jgi:hypothetical protein
MTALALGDGGQRRLDVAGGGPDGGWSYDFMAARTQDGLPLRILNEVETTHTASSNSSQAWKSGSTASGNAYSRHIAR